MRRYPLAVLFTLVLAASHSLAMAQQGGSDDAEDESEKASHPTVETGTLGLLGAGLAGLALSRMLRRRS